MPPFLQEDLDLTFGQDRASYEVTARTVKFLGCRDNGGTPTGEPPPDGGEEEEVLPL